MTLSLPNLTIVKQYVPGIYFVAVAAWIGFDNQNFWMGLMVVAFIIQMVLNNRYFNLILGSLTILWSAYMAFSLFVTTERTAQILTIALCFTVANLYMSRMLFLNQNFNMAALRENSLDDTLFI